MSTKDTVSEWFRQHLAGGPLAQNTAAYNQVHEAIPALIAALDAGPASSDSPAAGAQPEPAAQGDAAPAH